MPVITLLTDFGTADGYLGEVKGVLLGIAPEATLVDVSHDIPPHDVEAARLAVARYWRRFPVGTIHLIVVDPGVGSIRTALAIESEQRLLVGPDNGALSPALLIGGAKAVALPVPEGASATFHARDVFAPAAGRLALGHSIEMLGPPAIAPVIRRTPQPRRRPDGALDGEVIAIDRFGNAMTNLVSPRGGVIEVLGRQLPVQRTYSDVPAGSPLALVGSSGLIEIAVREGSAAAALMLTRGTAVRLCPAT